MPSGPKKKKGCLFWGAVAVGILVLLGIIGIAGTLFLGRRIALSYTDTAPRQVQPGETTKAKSQRVLQKRQRLEVALRANKRAEFRFDADDLNSLVAQSPEARDLRGRAAFRFEGDQLAVQASVPLKGMPGMEGRYLNGEFMLELHCSNGRANLVVTDVAVKGKTVPDMLKTKLSEEFTRRINADPGVRQALANVESIDVWDEQLVVRTGSGK